MARFKNDKPSLPASRKDGDKAIRTESSFSKRQGYRAIIRKEILDASEKVCPGHNRQEKCGARSINGFRRAARPRANDPPEIAEMLWAFRVLQEHGMLDAIVDRRDLREYLTNSLNISLS